MLDRTRNKLLALGIVLLLGCGKQTRGSRMIVSDPESLDFEIVEMSQNDVRQSATLENGSAGDVAVRVYGSCGCISVHPNEFLLTPNSQVQMEVIVSTHNRIGRFKEDVLVEAVSLAKIENKQINTFKIPIRVNVISSWEAIPRRIVLKSGGADEVLAIVGPTDLWKSIEVMPIGTGFEWIEETSVINSGREERRYRVRPNSSFSGGNHGLSFVVKGKSLAVLTVPIVVIPTSTANE